MIVYVAARRRRAAEPFRHALLHALAATEFKPRRGLFTPDLRFKRIHHHRPGPLIVPRPPGWPRGGRHTGGS